MYYLITETGLQYRYGVSPGSMSDSGRKCQPLCDILRSQARIYGGQNSTMDTIGNRGLGFLHLQ